MTIVLSYLLPFLVVLTVLVFFHELGHYLIARYNGIRVDVFSIGFGPELFGWNDKGGTRWKVSLIPLGGYVRMFGDVDASSRPDQEHLRTLTPEERSQSLHYKSVSARIAVSAAGPIANFLFAIVVLVGLFMIKGHPVYLPKVGVVIANSLAEKSGLQVGDVIQQVNGIPVTDFSDLREQVRGHIKDGLTLDIQREGSKQTLTIPAPAEPLKGLGIKPSLPDFQEISLPGALIKSVTLIGSCAVNLVSAITDLILGRGSADDLGSVISIGHVAGESAKGGVASLLLFMALLSINLGVINLFPVPVLDGGHILFYLIEGIRGKPVSERAQEYAFFIGFLLIMAITFYSLWNDIHKFKLISWLLGKG